jgi:hypothetical protein
VVPHTVAPIPAASAAVVGFSCTKLAVGITLIAAQHVMLRELAASALACAVVAAGAFGVIATKTAAVHLAASRSDRH